MQIDCHSSAKYKLSWHSLALLVKMKAISTAGGVLPIMAYTGGISRYFLRKMPSKHSRSFAFPGWEIILCKIRLSWSERADRIQLYGKAILTLTPPINIGSFRIDDGDGSENATLKMNSLFSETLSSLFLFAENVKCKRIFLALIWRPLSSLERERKIRRRLFTHVKLGIFRPTLGLNSP